MGREKEKVGGRGGERQRASASREGHEGHPLVKGRIFTFAI